MFQFRKLFGLAGQPDEDAVAVPPVADRSPSVALDPASAAEPVEGSVKGSIESSTESPTESSTIDQLKQVLSALRAYTVTFGPPDSELELRAVVGAILANVAAVENSQIEGSISEAIAALNSLGPDDSPIDVTAQLLAEQAAVWLQAREETVSNVLSAYLQQFAPDDAVWSAGEITSLVQTVIATLNDGSLSRSGGRLLLNRVTKSFDLKRAISRWVAPEWVAIAQRVASYVSKGDLQTEVQSIAWAYIQQFQSILSPQLIAQIMQAGPINVSPAELLSGDLSDFSQMLYYKFQLLEADPVVTKSHAEIAAEIHRAIADWQARQGSAVDVTERVQTDDLAVGSTWLRADS